MTPEILYSENPRLEQANATLNARYEDNKPFTSDDLEQFARAAGDAILLATDLMHDVKVIALDMSTKTKFDGNTEASETLKGIVEIINTLLPEDGADLLRSYADLYLIDRVEEMREAGK
ncbi:MAG: hypothetical protein Q4D87_08855 [Actinomycetaceae bacterium]|nr:hypothetical protein [Actinomycetaceae bacterium]